MWRTVLVIFSLLYAVCAGAVTPGTDKITLSDLDDVIRNAKNYDMVGEDRLDSCRTALARSKSLEQRYLIRPVQDGFGYLLCIEISRSGESARSYGLCRGVIHSTRQAVSDFGNEL